MRHYHKWNNLPEVRRRNPSKAPAVTCTKPAQIQSEWRSDQERTRNNTAQNMSCRTAAWDAVSQTGLTPSRSAIQEETGEDLRKRQGNATDRLCVFACLYRRCFYPKMKKRCAEDFYEVSYQQTMIQTARMPLKQQYFRQLYHYYSCWNLLP